MRILTKLNEPFRVCAAGGAVGEQADLKAVHGGHERQRAVLLRLAQQQVLRDVHDGGLAALRAGVSRRVPGYVTGLDAYLVGARATARPRVPASLKVSLP